MPTSSLHSHEPRSSLVLRSPALALTAVAALLVLAWLIWNGDAVTAFKQEAGPVTFFATMTILPALGFPITPFFVMAGAAFGSRVGLVGSAVALSLNLALCYWIARSGLRRVIVALLERFDYRIPDFERESRGALRFVMLTKLTPGLPAFMKSYLLGLVGVPFWTFFAASLLLTGAYALLLVYVGDTLREHELNHLIVLAIVLVLLAVGLHVWRKRRARLA
ncbi:MAG: VTT domain-containing protein [Myxococcales bacterium]